MNRTTRRTLAGLFLTTLGMAVLGGCSDPPQAPAVFQAPPPADCPPGAVDPAVQPSPPAPATTGGAPAPSALEHPSAPPAAAGNAASKNAQAATETAQLRVKRLVLTPGIEDREPAEPRTSFDRDETGRIYAFVEVENQNRVPGEIIVAFEPPDGGELRGNVKLEIGPHPRWRTWAFTRTAREVGTWTALVMTEEGEVLARAPFEITL